MAEGTTAKDGRRSMTGISSIQQRSFSVPWRSLASDSVSIVAARARESRLSRGTNDDDDDNEKSMKSEERKYGRPVESLAKFHCNVTFMNSKAVCNEDLSQCRKVVFRDEFLKSLLY